MEEQVVPGLNIRLASSVPHVKAPPLRSKKVAVKSDEKECTVPALRAAKRAKTEASVSELSPAAEYPGKVRWATPLRVGKWVERWQSARELASHVAVRAKERVDVAKAVRMVIAEAVVENVGQALPVQTVTKWLCLLFEYLELNEDEQVLVVCLLRKFAHSGGKFIGQGDWARPQRWECVVAISCYFAVLLTEEFPGRTSLDLRELLGPNFRFGSEQVSFLKIVDWRISVDDVSFAEAKKRCINVAKNVTGELERLREWFRRPNVPALLNLDSPPLSLPSPVPSLSDSVATPITPVVSSEPSKKRKFSALAPADDTSMVPLSFGAALVPPASRQWFPHGW